MGEAMRGDGGRWGAMGVDKGQWGAVAKWSRSNGEVVA